MTTKLASSVSDDSTPVRERRRRSRVKLSCFILVRPLEPDAEFFESIILTTNSCRGGVSFETDSEVYSPRMRLLITYPYSLHPCAINRDYIGEVVRIKAIADRRYSVAVRLLTTAKLTIPHGSSLHSSNLWNVLWKRATLHHGSAKTDCAATDKASR